MTFSFKTIVAYYWTLHLNLNDIEATEAHACEVSALGLARHEAFGGSLHLLLVEQEGSHHGVRADHTAEVALSALVRQPDLTSSAEKAAVH